MLPDRVSRKLTALGCIMVFCKAGDTKRGKMESRTLGNLNVRFGGRLTRDPSGRSQPIPLFYALAA